MTNEDIKRIAMEQSAIDFNCSVNDFLHKGNTVAISRLNEGRKKCYQKPMFCGLGYYGEGLVASVDEGIKDFVEAFIGKYPGYRCFDTPQMNALNWELAKYKKCVCFLAEFFLPDINQKVPVNEAVQIKIIREDEIPELYQDDRFHMALGYDNSGEKKDVIAAVGYIDGKIAGVAGASNDCDSMWQIGIDVLPEYRNLGVASTLTKRLTDEIIILGKVPYYCTAWSNIASKRNALRCGYKTAWVELAAIATSDAMKMIGEEIRCE
jgi:GNAT superfamily N-acetyltransferase